MEFKLPELGEGVTEGELVKWRVNPGDTVKHDQPLCEIMTDKATIEIPSAFEGTVASVHAKEGDLVRVGQTLLKFETGGAAQRTAQPETAPVQETPMVAPSAAARPSSEGSKQQGVATSSPGAQAPRGGAPAELAENVAASPATRKLASEAGIDLRQVPATGPNGRVLKEDVQNFLDRGARPSGPAATPPPAAPAKTAPPRPPVSVAQPPRVSAPAGRAGAGGGTQGPASEREERIPFHGLRKKIAERMRQSKDHAAHFTYVEEADATELVKLRAHAKEIGERHGIKVTYLPFIMKAMVAAARHFPLLNSTLDEQAGQIIVKKYFNIGLSIQTDDGLTAPVVKNVEGKTVLELARDIQDLVDRARKKQLALSDFQDSTITLTNAGSIGGLFATPVINYPEVAILGFNKIFRKPVVKVIDGKEQIVIRDWTYFSISLDHRVVDGAVGAEFMKVFIQYVENPGFLLLD